MSSSFLQSSFFKAILSLIVLVLTFIALTAFAAWSGPSSSSDNRAPFLNLGPVTQTKTGRLNITTGGSVLGSAKFEVAGPAMLAGGVNAEGIGSQTSALVLGDVYVGYAGSPSAAPTPNSSAPSTPSYELYGNVMVSNDIKAENLAHGNAGALQQVCTTQSGWLIPCTITLPTLTLPEVCGDPTASNYAGPYLFNSVTFNHDLCEYVFYPIDPAYEGCFVAGTQILLADGTYKNIEDIQTGEVLKGSKGDNPVMKRYKIDYKGNMYSINGSGYFVSETHPFMTTEGWKSFNPEGTRKESPTLDVSLLEKGDVLIREDGKKEVLETFSSRYENVTVYNFGLNGSRDFYADGYLVHNVDLFPIAEALPDFQNWKGGLCGGSYPGYQQSGYTYQEWTDVCSGSGQSIPACPAGTYPNTQTWSGDVYDNTCCPDYGNGMAIDCAA